MKIVVTGGRDFEDADLAFAVLDELHAADPITHLLHGDARGADRTCRNWAIARGIPHTPMPADWDKYERAAGFIRNAEMAKTNPDLCVAFPGGNGTAHMVAQCIKHGIKIHRVHL